MERRKFISAIGASIATVSVAGCIGQDGDANTETDTNTETETETSTTTDTTTDSPNGGDDQTGTEKSTGTPAEDVESVIGNTPDGIEVRNTQLFIKGDSNARVTGTIENTSDQDFEELEVQATLIDDEDDILGKWFDNTEEREAGGLASGQTWDFTIEFETPDLDTVARYRVDVDGDIDQLVWEGDSGTTTGTETTTS